MRFPIQKCVCLLLYVKVSLLYKFRYLYVVKGDSKSWENPSFLETNRNKCFQKVCIFPRFRNGIFGKSDNFFEINSYLIIKWKPLNRTPRE